MLPYGSSRLEPVLLQGVKDGEGATRGSTLKELEWQQIACGAFHMVGLTPEGDVHTWGHGANGSQRHGDEDDVYKPKLLITTSLSGKEVVHVICGSWHTAVIDNRGELYTWCVQKKTD